MRVPRRDRAPDPVGHRTDPDRQPARARGSAALAAGRLVDARLEFREAAELSTGVNGTDERLLAAHAAIWAGDLAGASAELDAIDASGFRSPAVEARGSQSGPAGRGRGQRAEALRLYRDALRRWRD